MWKTIEKGFKEEVKTYGLFVAVLIIAAIVFLIVSFILIIFSSNYFGQNCNLKIAFASIGTFLVSMGLVQRAKKASKSAGKKK